MSDSWPCIDEILIIYVYLKSFYVRKRISIRYCVRRSAGRCRIRSMVHREPTWPYITIPQMYIAFLYSSVSPPLYFQRWLSPA